MLTETPPVCHIVKQQTREAQTDAILILNVMAKEHVQNLGIAKASADAIMNGIIIPSKKR